jgi:hypothetical protein
LCGPLVSTQTADVLKQRSSATTYTASLHVAVASPGQQASSFWLLCHIASPAEPTTASQAAAESDTGTTA